MNEEIRNELISITKRLKEIAMKENVYLYTSACKNIGNEPRLIINYVDGWTRNNMTREMKEEVFITEAGV